MLAFDKIPLTPDCREFVRVFEDATIGMALVSSGGHFMQVNRALCRMLGYSEHELLGREIASVTLTDDVAIERRQLRRALDGEIDHYQLEHRFRHARGEVVWTHLSVSLIRDSSGQSRYFIAQMQDISETRRATEELRTTRARLVMLMECLPMGIVLESEQRGILLANQSFCTLLRLRSTPEALVGLNAETLNEETRHLFARPEYVDTRMAEIVRQRRRVIQETVEMADGRVLQRDYVPVLLDAEGPGHLWTWRENVQRRGAD